MKLLQAILVACLLLGYPWAGLAREATAPKPWGPMSEIEAAAREEGRLVIYSAPGHANREVQRAISKHFKAKYAINVDWTTLSGRDISPRVLAEQRTKRPVVDVVMSGIGGAYSDFKPRGYVVPILAPSILEKGIWRLDPATAVPTDRDWLFIFFSLQPGFLINTNLVAPGEEPRSYQDLLDSKWKGKIVLQTPGRGGTGSGWFRATYRKFGLDYMRALAKQVAIVANVSDPPDAVARGSYAVAVAPTSSRGLGLAKQGAPVRFVRPREGLHLAPQGISFVANAPHPNAAKVYLNWFFTKEGQTLYSVNSIVVSLRKDVTQDHMPAGLRYVQGQPFLMPAMEDLKPKRSRELFKLGGQIFEKGR